MSSKLLTDTYRQVKRADRPAADGKLPVSSNKGVSEDLEVLKQFDLKWEYGPCTGITRIERWNRAQKHGLNPPEKVRDLINRHPGDETYTKNLWNGYDL